MHPHALFGLLADATRLHILDVLRSGELSVSDLVERTDIHQSGVSRHLGILRANGIVSVRPEGQRRLYSLQPDAFREIDRWLLDYRALWDGRLDRLTGELKRKQKASREKER